MPWVTEDEPRLLPHRSLKIWQLHNRPLLDKHPFCGKISPVSAAAETLVQGWCFFPIPHVIKLFHDRFEDQPMHYSSTRIEDQSPMFFVQNFQNQMKSPPLLGPAVTGTGTGTIALAPTFGSFTLLEPVSH
jgi:hypothetical protein